MTEPELITLARSQGATHYSRIIGAFWRKGRDGLEVAKVQAGTLGPWELDWRTHPSESAIRL